jgi:hypothetical protein
MDKTLDTVTLVHRLIIAVALALFLVGISIGHPDAAYDEATGEIESLQEGIGAASEQVDNAYKAIYDKSELKFTTLSWLRRHNSEEQDIDIQVVTPEDVAVPDSEQDPLVTLNAQIKWADWIYRDLDYPFFLCNADRSKFLHSLDELFRGSPKPKFIQLGVYIRSRTEGTNPGRQFGCEIELQYEVQIGTQSGIRRAILSVPTTVVDVTEVEPPGPNWIDLDVAGAFKENGLGDWEDSRALLVPNLWGLWTDLGGRTPAAAEAFLEQKKKEEAEKSKEKIEILGESLSRSVTIIMASVVELCLMMYLLAHMIQVHRMLPEHEAAISESPFYGIMCTWFGRLVILFTFVIPFCVCLFDLARVLPSLKVEWLGPDWIVGWATRWLLVSLVGITDWLLLLQAHRTVALLKPTTKDASAAAEERAPQ